MKLGVAAEILHTAEDLEQSARFYRALGLEVVEQDGAVSVLCESLHLRLIERNIPGSTLAYRTQDVECVANHVSNLGLTVKDDPDGVLVYGPELERVLISYAEENVPRHHMDTISSLFALPTQQVRRALVFWRTLGFLRIGGNVLRPDQWATIYDGRLPIMLASPLSISGPAIVFANRLTDQQLEALKKAGFGANVHASSPARATLFSPEQQTLIYGRLM